MPFILRKDLFAALQHPFRLFTKAHARLGPLAVEKIEVGLRALPFGRCTFRAPLLQGGQHHMQQRIGLALAISR